jgi:hypothetical protein
LPVINQSISVIRYKANDKNIISDINADRTGFSWADSPRDKAMEFITHHVKANAKLMPIETGEFPFLPSRSPIEIPISIRIKLITGKDNLE